METEIQKYKPILLGIIIDVSASMKKNWKNDDDSMPMLKVVKKTLDNEIARIARLQKLTVHKRKSPTLDVFCLGMGFKKPLLKMDELPANIKSRWMGKKKDSSAQITIIDDTVVCDLLALNKIIPTKSELEQIRDKLNKDWNVYADQILVNVVIPKDAEKQLCDYIKEQLYQSAQAKMKRGWKYKWWTRLNAKETNRLSKLSRFFLKTFSRELNMQSAIINKVAENQSVKYSNNIKSNAQTVFNQKQLEYNSFIEKALDDFISTQVSIILRLLSIGHNKSLIFSYFDEEKAFQQAKLIYNHLEKEVKNNSGKAWVQNRTALSFAKKTIGASIDNREVQRLTKQVIHKNGWAILRPVVERTVQDIFLRSFEHKILKLMPEWIELASMHELTIAAKDTFKLLPDEYEGEIYSEEFMFGQAHINKALNLAALRFLDPSYKNREKLLLIISDGQFPITSPDKFANIVKDEFIKADFLAYADTLKKAGVTIVVGYVVNKTILTQIVSQWFTNWPAGAKLLFDMASTLEDGAQIAKRFEQIDMEPSKKKLFYQLNRGEMLASLLRAVTNSHEDLDVE